MSTSFIANFFDGLTSKKGAALAVPAILLFGATIAVGQQRGPQLEAAAGGPVVIAQATPTAPTAPATQTPPAAPSAAGKAFSPEQRSAIETIVKEYLLANPEVMAEIQANLEAKMERIQAEKMKSALSTHAAELFRSTTAPVVGDPKGDVTIIEFSDYNCGYCRRAVSEVAKVVESDKKVRFVFREFPIMSPASEVVARLALAARNQGKYWELHRAVMAGQGQASEASALREAQRLGLDIERLKKDAASPEIRKEIADNRALATKMGINGTPFFMIGDRVVPGAPENLAEVLKENIAEVRRTGCKVC